MNKPLWFSSLAKFVSSLTAEVAVGMGKRCWPNDPLKKMQSDVQGFPERVTFDPSRSFTPEGAAMKIRRLFFVTAAILTALLASNAHAQVSLTATAGSPTGSFTTLKGAFDAINAGTHQGVITISITGNTTETATAALNASGSGSALYTSILISPSGGAARTISGAITAGSPLINFNGADNVTIDGVNSSGNSLTISNTTVSPTSGTSTIQFINGATGNTITNASIQGSFSAAVTTNGGNIYFATDATTANGNDNNTISNCAIGPAGANLPTKGIYSNGTTTTTALNNSGIVITNNTIFDYFGGAVSSGGVYLAGGTTDCNVTNNKFYQSATRTQTTGTQHSAIWINSTGNNFLVSGNTIGFATSGGAGTYTFVGVASSVLIPVYLSVGTTTATSVQGNTIAGIAMSGAQSGTSSSAAFRGIYVASGLTTIGDVTGNTIGSQSATGSITYTSSSSSASDVMGMFNFGSSAWTVSNNNIGGITAANSSTGASNVYGIRYNTSSAVSTTVQSNLIGGTVANSLQSTSTATGTQVVGIFASTSSSTIQGNTIRNLTAAGGTGTTTAASVVGVAFVSTSVNNTVRQNTIQSLSNTSAAAAATVIGIQYNASTGSNLVSRNLLYGLTNSSTAGIIHGINVSSGTTTYQNNMIDLGNGSSVSNQINGVNETSGTDNFFHNSIYIGGTGVASGTVNTFAFNSTVTTNTRSFRDNIFYNARSNASGTGVHYAIQVGGTLPNPTGLTSNNNILLATGTGGAIGRFNALSQSPLGTWQSATGQDAASFSTPYDPQFLSPTAATPDLHINASLTSVAEGNGFDVGVLDDYDGQTRASLTPVDIGADAGNFTGLDLSAPTIVYTPLANTTSTSARTLSATITDVSGVPTSGTGLPVLYWKIGAGAYSPATGVSMGSGVYQFTFGAGVVLGNTVSYYIVAQDGAVSPNVGASPSAGASGFTANPPAAATPPTTPSTYTIGAAISGTVTVCPGGSCTYTTLTNASGAFADINSKIATGNINIEIAADLTTEDGSNALNALTVEPTGSTYLVHIYPTNAPFVGSRLITGSNSGGLIRLNAADFVTIDGSNGGASTDRTLTITNTNTGTSSAVVWLQSSGTDGATNNVVKNLIVKGSGNTQTLIGIGIGSSTVSISSTGSNDNSNTIQNNSVSKTQYGIYSGGASAAAKNTGNTVSQNDINAVSPDNVAIGGILVNFESGITISQNKIAHILSGTTPAFGITLGVRPSNTYTTFTGSEVVGATVSRNMIDDIVRNGDGTSFGIGVASVATAASAANTLSNNMISQVRTTAATPSDFGAGILVGGGTAGSTVLYFNSISMTGVGSNSSPTFGIVLGGTNPTVDMRNNIVVNTQTTTTGKTYALGLTYSSPYTNLTSDYNDFLNTGTTATFAVVGGLGNTPTGDKTSLGAWKLETSKDGSSISGDPKFLSASDLHISTVLTTPIESAGFPVSVVVDYDGDSRLSPPDIGADEGTFIAPVVNDVQATQFVEPVNLGSKPVGATFSPQATFTNNGTANQTNVPVRFRIVDPLSVEIYNFTTTIASLTSGATASATFSPTVTVSLPGTYTMFAKAELPGDTVGGNDQIAGSFTVEAPLCGNYDVGSGGAFSSLTGAGGAFSKLNGLGASCSVTFSIVSDLSGETGATALNQWTETGGGGYTVGIRPTGAVRAITGSFNGPLVRVLASRVTIDGSLGGASTDRSLTITNTSTTTPGVVLFGSVGTTPIGTDALKNCVIVNGANTSSAVVVSDSATVGNAGYFSGITIQNNDIRKAYIGVFANGGTTPQNGSGLALQQNTLNNTGTNAIRLVGLYMQGVNGATVSQNTIGNFSNTDAENDMGIWLASGTINATVSGNTVTTLGYTGTSANAPIGINVTSGVASTGIVVSGNTVSGLSTNGTTQVRGIAVPVAGTSDLTIEKNNVQGIINTSTSTYGAYGLDISGGDNIVVRNNFVSNVNFDMTGGLAFSTTFGVFGIRVGAGIGHKIYDNSVNLYGTPTGTATSALLSAAFALVNTSSTGCDVRDNIFANNISGGTTSIAHVSVFLPSGGTSLMGLTWNNNAYFSGATAASQGIAQAGTTAGTGFYLASNFNPGSTSPATNLRAYTSTLGFTANDSASQASTAAVPYVAATDLHLKSPGLNSVEDVGAPIGTVTDDYDGQTRSLVATDIGADEVDRCANVTCNNTQCATYACNPANGLCVATPRTSDTGCVGTSNGGQCDGADHCSGVDDSCVDVFAFAGTFCGTPGQCENQYTCNGSDGACHSNGFRPADTECNGLSNGGPCDGSDHCSGTDSSCVDVYADSGTFCGTPGQCENQDLCNGMDGACHDQGFKDSSTLCIGSSNGGACDNDSMDRCSGTDNTCNDAYQANGYACNGVPGQCENQDTCNGMDGTCHDGGVKDSSTSCNGLSQGGPCDGADHCSGTDSSCVDVYQDNGTACGTPGQCENQDTCNGMDGACHDQGFKDSSTLCVGSSNGGACDNDSMDRCSGTDGTCVDAYQSNGYACNGAPGQCEFQDTCNGMDGSCHDGGFKPDTASCTGTSNGGPCDGADHCSGTDNSCVDVYEANGTACNGAPGQCEFQDTCNGIDGSCHDGGFKPDTASCSGTSNGGPCDGVDHCSGTDNSCVDVYAANGTACNGAPGQCEFQDTCNGMDGACHDGGVKDASTSCTGTSQGGACDGLDHCSGTDSSCVDVFLASGTVCRPAVSSCDVAETCTGASGTCPADVTGGPVSVTATAGTTGPTSYPTLGAAFTAINAGTHQGAIAISICANLNEGATPATLNSSGAGSALYTSVSIRPAAQGLSVVGSPVTGFGVIQLNGADNVTIDCDDPGTAGINRDLTISNTAAATVVANSAIRIATSTAVTSADNDTIKNCIVNGNVTGGNLSTITSTTGSSGISFGIVAGGGGGATATGAPVALTAAAGTSAPSGTTMNALLIDNNVVNQAARGIVVFGAASTVSTGVTVTNNTVGAAGTLTGNPPYTTPTTTVYCKGISVAGTAAATVTGNTVRNVLSYVGNTMTGIELPSSIGTGTVAVNANTITGVVQNNTSGAAAQGINLASATGTGYSVSGNTVSNIQTMAGSSMFGIQLSTTSTAGTVENNRVSTIYSRGSGGFGSYGVNLVAGNAITLRNNFIWDVNAFLNNSAISSTFGAYGIRIAAGLNHKIYHNSVSLSGAFVGASTLSMSAAFEIISTGTTLTGIDVRNNIFSNTMTGAVSPTPVVAVFLPSGGTSTMNLNLNNNGYYQGSGTGAAIGQVGTTSGTGVYPASGFNPASTSGTTNLRTYTSTLRSPNTNDNASFAASTPVPFASATDLHINSGLSSTPLESGGAAVGVGVDIDNDVRPGPAGSTHGGATAPDVGADEFDGVPLFANDIAASAFVDPTNGGSKPENVSFSPQASFTNVGTAAQTNVTVRYRILSGITEIYNDTQVIASLNPGASTTVTFTATSRTAGTYNIEASSELVGDQATGNDKITGSFTVESPLCGNYDVGTGGAFSSLTNPGGAFSKLNGLGASCDVTFSIVSDLSGETGAVGMNQWAEFFVGPYSVGIRPTGAPRTISGSFNGALIRILASRVTIDGSIGGTGTDRSLTITNTSTTTPSVVLFGSVGTTPIGSDYLRNCIIVNGANSSSAVVVSDSATLGGQGYFSGITIQNNSIQKAFIGVYANGGTTPQTGANLTYTQNTLNTSGANALRLVGLYMQGVNGATVTQNTIGNFSNTDAENDTGIWLASGTINATVSGNTISTLGYTGTAANAPVGINVTSGVASTGISVTGNSVSDISSNGTSQVRGIAVSGTTSDLTIEKNHVTGIINTSTGTYGAYGLDISGGNNIVVKNNFVSNVSFNMTGGVAFSTTFSVYGIRVGAGTGIKVYDNSVNLYGALPGTPNSAILTTAFGLIATTSTGCDVRDNIFANNISGGTTSVAHVSVFLPSGGTSAMGLTFNNNAYFHGTNAAQQGAGQAGTTPGTNFYTNLAALRAYTSTLGSASNDNASLESTAAVPFVSATDLHLVSPGLNSVENVGVPIATVTDDIDGDTRSVVATDIGADEVDRCANVTCTSTQCVSYTCDQADGICKPTILPADTHCNGTFQGGACDDDPADHCSGTDDTCVDAFQANGTACGAPGQCENQDTCNGLDSACHDNGFKPDTASCNGMSNGGPCDGTDHCSGTDNSCVDVYQANGTFCGGAPGQCENQDTCNGMDGSCHDGGFQPDTTPCNDGEACTYGETCTAGTCGGGIAVTCTSDQCVTRSCNGTATCTETPLTGTACNDNQACTYDDTCQSGTCVGTAISCTNDQCNTRACNGTSTCSVTPLTGNTCDDGNVCTGTDFCNNGSCVGTVTTVVTSGNMHGWVPWDDSTDTPSGTATFVSGPATPPLHAGSARFQLNGSIADKQNLLLPGVYGGTRLDQITTLRYSTYRSSFDIGNNLAVSLQFDMDYDLTDALTPFSGRLVFEPYNTYPGGVPQNTWQAWSPKDGVWWATRAPYNALCPISAPCTWAQVLQNWPNAGIGTVFSGVYLRAGSPWGAFDGNVDALTIGVNGVATTYDFEPADATDSCDDGNDCTYGDTCSNGVCGGTPVSCVSDACTTRTCNGTATCTETVANEGGPCDDANACTYGDTCNNGTCAGTTITCTSDQCNTRACNGTATCTETPLSGNSCDDANACTYGDTCNNGACVGNTVTCTSDQCNTRVCNGTATCTVTPLSGNSCSDGNACTYGDTCSGGACVGTAIVCTSDQCNTRSCNGTSVCSVLPLTGNSCNDGNHCSQNDVCNNGVCAGSPVPAPSAINNSVRVNKAPTNTTITWTDPPGSYNVYRGSKGSGAWSYNQGCLSTSVSGNSSQDTDVPLPNHFFYYLVTRVDTCFESTLGTNSAGATRPNSSPCAIPADGDGDGVPDLTDNCPTVANTDQSDVDFDGVGDACDNCIFVSNFTQDDTDNDGIGDSCDPDIDNDGVLNGVDNCVYVYNPDQTDANNNNVGDACEPSRLTRPPK